MPLSVVVNESDRKGACKLIGAHTELLTNGGKLRVAVTIAMPSPRSSQFGDEKAAEKKPEEEAPPLCLGVADLPWCAEKVEEA